MATAKKVSKKHLQIDKSQTSSLIAIVCATVVVVFCLFGFKAMVVKGLYQKRALHAKNDVVDQLKSNYSSANTLFTQYKVFASNDPNVLGGSVTGQANLDGDNPKIVLDSLPSAYDAPALASSLEKILQGRGITINSIKVTDDPNSFPDKSQDNPQSVMIPLSFDGTANFQTAPQLLQDFERSIRAFDVTKIEISGTDNTLKLNVDMNTYYQPAKGLNLAPTKEVQ